MSSDDLELVEAPLSTEQLAARYREMCDDARFLNIPGKVELDLWGRVLMTPASTNHGRIQGRICQKLAHLGGETLIEWASTQFMLAHGAETPLTRAPEICIEVLSPSNSVQEMEEKRAAYLASGALEVWLVYPKSKRCEFHGAAGALAQSAYPFDWAGVFA